MTAQTKVPTPRTAAMMQRAAQNVMSKMPISGADAVIAFMDSVTDEVMAIERDLAAAQAGHRLVSATNQTLVGEIAALAAPACAAPVPVAWRVHRDVEYESREYFHTVAEANANAAQGVCSTHVTPLFTAPPDFQAGLEMAAKVCQDYMAECRSMGAGVSTHSAKICRDRICALAARKEG